MPADQVKAYFAAMATLMTVSTVVTLLAIGIALCRRPWWPLWIMLAGQSLDLLTDRHLALMPPSMPMRGLAMGITTLGICALTIKLSGKER